MTYEKFEHQVLGMLLEGDDPRLEKLAMQSWDTEVLSRDETEMGFNVKFLAPALLAIHESEGRIFGVEAKLSENEIINLELVIKNGLIDRLKGTFTAEMRYADLVRRYQELTFSYKNETSSEVNFHSDNHEIDEGAFVKNIATISKEIDANISKGSALEQEDAEASEDMALIEEPFTLASEEQEIEKELETEDKSQGVETSVDDSLASNLSSVAPSLHGAAQIGQVPESEQGAEVIQQKEELEISEEIADVDMLKSVAETSDAVASEEDHLMLPPSFSIPKIPDAIKKRWSGEEVALLKETLPQENSQEDTTHQRVVLDHPVKDTRFESIVEGKAPQGPVSLSELLEADTIKEEPFEFKNLTPKELSDPNLEIESAIEIDPEELESEALSAVDLDEVNRSIALMEKKNKELKIITILIVLITIVAIGFIISFALNQ